MVLRLLLTFLIGTSAWAGEAPAVLNLQRNLRSEIAKKFPGARIELIGTIHLNRGTTDSQESISIQNIMPRGEAMFSGPDAEGWASFSAWMPAHIATRRIQIGEKLSPEMFVSQDVNVAMGNATEYRGVIMDRSAPVTGLEARQTIIEGQFLLSTAVQRIPDVRRGDSVRIQLVSGGLVVSTLGNAEEPGYIKGRIHVIAAKTKREFVGDLLPGGIVEVRL